METGQSVASTLGSAAEVVGRKGPLLDSVKHTFTSVKMRVTEMITEAVESGIRAGMALGEVLGQAGEFSARTSNSQLVPIAIKAAAPTRLRMAETFRSPDGPQMPPSRKRPGYSQ